MRYLIIFVGVLMLHAEDAPKPNLEQQLAEAQAEIRLYQQGLFQCQAVQIHEQAQKQAQKAKQ